MRLASLLGQSLLYLSGVFLIAGIGFCGPSWEGVQVSACESIKQAAIDVGNAGKFKPTVDVLKGQRDPLEIS